MKKQYYSLSDLLKLDLTPLKKRALQYRFNRLLKEQKLIYGKNLFRTGRKWQIHYSAISLFNYHSLMKNNLK